MKKIFSNAINKFIYNTEVNSLDVCKRDKLNSFIDTFNKSCELYINKGIIINLDTDSELFYFQYRYVFNKEYRILIMPNGFQIAIKTTDEPIFTYKDNQITPNEAKRIIQEI